MNYYFEGMVKSYEARVAKPDKKIFDIAAKEFGINPEKTLFIDDSPYNIAVAKELGWQGVEVKPGSDSLVKIIEDYISLQY
ncbi:MULTISPECIES: HAD-IA family hydrolase [Bacteroidales]|uniref:HAD-IA family hydrolase n=1 Tax=Bacteroidales TaxID=171549 RepID=UPI002711D65F|nr:HAD-IA family hydrolase [uncultured Duncaniella sp.]